MVLPLISRDVVVAAAVAVVQGDFVFAFVVIVGVIYGSDE